MPSLLGTEQSLTASEEQCFGLVFSSKIESSLFAPIEVHGSSAESEAQLQNTSAARAKLWVQSSGMTKASNYNKGYGAELKKNAVQKHCTVFVPS